MNIFIVRHGQTDWNLEKRCAGRIDVPLNETGINEAKKIKEELKNIKFDKVYSSPLKRAYETAKIITDHEIIKDERIIERSNGEFEGMLKSDIKIKINFNDPNGNDYGVEPVKNVRKRINNFFDDITNDNNLENILVVMHAGVGIYARCYFEGDPVDGDYLKYKMKNCEILKYTINN